MRAPDNATLYFGGFTRPANPALVHRYMMGECAYLALAFERLYGWEMKSFVSHIAVRSPDGAFWDIRGKMTREQVGEELHLPAGFVPSPIGFAEIEKMMRYGLMSRGDFCERKLASAIELLRTLMPAGADAP